MTRTRFAFLSIFALAIGACGGRSALHVETSDGGGTSSDGGATKRDAGPDGGSLRDSGLGSGDLGRFDGSIGPGDGRPTDGSQILPDGRPTDALPSPDFGRSDGPVVPGDGPNARNDGPQRPDGPSLPDGVDGPIAPADAPPATLTRIEISPASPITVNVGTPRTLTITAIYSNSTTQDVSGASTVVSADPTVLTVSGVTLTGLGTKVATTTITATYQGQTATATVTVNGQNPLTSISINNVPTTALAVGATVNLVATGVFADGTSQDVTAQATWASSAASVASVGSTGATAGQVTGVAAGTFTVTATVGSVVGTSATMTVSAKKLVSIAITPSNPTLQVGLTNQAFTATGTYDDTSTADVTQQASWSSSNAAVLTVVAGGANAGRVSTVAAGAATVTATIGSVSGTDQVTVTPARLRTITVSGPTVLMVGNPQSYTATGTYTDNTTADLTTTVTWSSSDNTILTLSNAAGSVGLASGVAAGTANVQATLNGVTGRARVTVSNATLISITVTPATVDNLIVGLSSQLKATGLYGDPTNANTQFSIDVTASATWTVASTTVATVGNTAGTAGLVTGEAAGTTTVKATLSGQSGSATVNVVSANLVSIAINPSTASVRVGNTYPFTATGTFNNQTTADITNNVTWTSSNTATATISNAAGSNGVATGVAASTTPVTITATLNGQNATASLTVNVARIVSISIAPAGAQTINTGATQAYTLTGVYENGTTTTALTGVTWSSSNTAVATIAANPGRGGPFGGGAGATATGVAAGTTTIAAAYTTADGTALSDSVTLTVKTPATVIAIRLTPATASIQVGATQAYTVEADYSDGTTAVVAGATLTTSNGVVASVGGGGFGGGLVVTGQAAGSATITATYTTGGKTFNDTASLTVTQGSPPIGLYIEPASATVNVDGTQQFRALTQNSDGTTTDVTTSSSTAWTTSDGTLATVTTASAGIGRGGVFAAGGGGLATGLAAGSATITATYTSPSGTAFSATATLTIVSKTPQSLLISPASASILLNGTQAFTATLVYTDGTTANVTGTASWSTSDATVVVMTNAATGGRGGGPGGPGIVGGGTATAVGVGTATVTASYTPSNATAALTATASVTVTDPPILSLQITPTTPTVYLSSGPNQQFTATLIYTDFTTRNVTASAQWSSSTPAVAVISTSGGTVGRATGLTVGTSTITATYVGSTTVTASTTLTVSSRKLTAVQVTPTNPTAHLGINQAFVATAVYDDGSKATVTTGATWTSSDTTIATVTSGGPSSGVVTPIKAGSTTITANYGGLSGTSLLTVSAGTLSSIAITPSPLSVVVGAHQQLTATGTYSDGSTQDVTSSALWLSTDSVATVSNASGSVGLLTAVSAGSAAVSAKFQSVTGTLTVTVTAN